MRIPSKVVCLWSCLTAFTFIHTAVAQDYPVEPLSEAGYEEGVAPADYMGSSMLEDGSEDPYGDGQGYAPLAYQDPAPNPYVAAAMPPGAIGMAPMMPPSTNYYPQISPFDEPVMQRTYRQRGIWVNDPIYGNREYSFRLEYMRAGFNPPGTDLIGDPRVGVPASLRGFQAVSTGVFANGEDLLSDGLRGTFLIANADSSSLEMSAFWIAESTATYHPFGKGDPTDIDTIRARGFIGLSDGTDAGVAVPYDTNFELNYKQAAFGADITLSTMPMVDIPGIRLRTTYGVKYLNVRELFSLNGADSNLSYTANAQGVPIPATVIPNPNGNPPYESDLISRTKSYLAGPEVGVRYEVGGQHFLLYGQSRFALVVNHEIADLSGDQIGDGFFGDGFPDPTPDNPHPAAFHDHRSTTHISPVYSQDFYFKGKVFRHLPFFNDMPLLANADMLVGYNFALVGNMIRPTKIIDWRVDNPKIDLSHSRWYYQAVTFGLQWEF